MSSQSRVFTFLLRICWFIYKSPLNDVRHRGRTVISDRQKRLFIRFFFITHFIISQTIIFLRKCCKQCMYVPFEYRRMSDRRIFMFYLMGIVIFFSFSLSLSLSLSLPHFYNIALCSYLIKQKLENVGHNLTLQTLTIRLRSPAGK